MSHEPRAAPVGSGCGGQHVARRHCAGECENSRAHLCANSSAKFRASCHRFVAGLAPTVRRRMRTRPARPPREHQLSRRQPLQARAAADLGNDAAKPARSRARPPFSIRPCAGIGAQQVLGACLDLRSFNDAVLATGSVPLAALESRIDAWIAGQQDSVARYAGGTSFEPPGVLFRAQTPRWR